MKNFWFNRGKRRRLMEFLNNKFGDRKFVHEGMTDEESAEVGKAFFEHPDYEEEFGWWIDEEGAFQVVEDGIN